MTRLIIVRHGETYLNLKDVFQGWIDSELTEKGKKQAEKLRKRLEDERIDAIYSSPFKRAITTAEIIKGKRDIPIITEDSFKEIKCGIWEGSRFMYIKKKYPEEYSVWEKAPHLHKIPEGETFIEVYKRARKGIKEVIEKHKGKTILISTHMVTTLLLMTYFGGEGIHELWETPKQGNTALNVIEVDDNGEISIVQRGDDSHLDGFEREYKFWENGCN